jgi:hypothetical protein
LGTLIDSHSSYGTASSKKSYLSSFQTVFRLILNRLVHRIKDSVLR